ncbi:MAG: ABC transporter permease [Clostridia bacterium]|nr:ABC transporter permease [Clostridia bacterium]
MDSKKKTLSRLFNNGNGISSSLIGVVAVIVIGMLVNYQSFFTISNFLNVGQQAASRGLIACGMFMVIVSGTIDLSVASLYALCGYLCMYFSNYNLLLGLLVPFGCAALHGIITATLIQKCRFHTWVVTIAMQMMLNGILYICTNGYTYAPERVDPFLSWLGNASLFGVSSSLICFILVYVVFAILLKTRVSFRALYSLGGNKEAAGMMGINLYATRVRAHVICSCMACFSGMLTCCRSMSALPQMGAGYEMYAIASCVLGGVYMSGGRGHVFGAFIGAWLVSFINNVFNIQTLFTTYWYQVIVGLLVIIVITSQSMEQFRISLVKGRNHAKRKAKLHNIAS